MKISKVDHVKTAVTLGNSTQKGIIYKDPANGTPLNTEKHVYKVINRARKVRKRTYDIFNLEKADDYDRYEREVLKDINIAFSKSVIRTENRKPDIGKLAKDIRNSVNNDNEVNIEYLINKTVRKALSKEATRDAIILLLTKSFRNENFSEEEKSNIQKNFIEIAWKDCDCMGVEANAINGIKHQNMVIQPIEKDGKSVLSTAVITNQKSQKAKRKAAFRKMLSDYATIDPNVRMEMLRKLRRIVVLYIYGKEELPEGLFDVWSDHAKRRNDGGRFVECEFVTNEKGFPKKTITDLDFKELVRQKNIERFNTSKNYIDSCKGEDIFFADMQLNMFWINRISLMVENLFAHRLGSISEYKISKGYIGEKIWKEVINYLSIKYIAIGKAVYNTAASVNDTGNVELGTILADYEKGISSFDYEMIKAEEELQRETAVYTSFAINNLSRTALNPSIERNKNEEDILSIKSENLEKYAYSDSRDRILQLFGGKSKWDDFDFQSYESNNESNSATSLLNTTVQIIKAMRNESFHFYTANRNAGDWNQVLVCSMFEHDAKEYNAVIKNKFYSNNLPMFYKISDLETALQDLYEQPANRATQMPSFNKVFVRNAFPEYLRTKCKRTPNFDPDSMMKWHSAVYYLLKEMYYNRFINDSSSKKLFLDAVNSIKPKDDKEKRASDDFKKKIRDIEKYSLPEICQIIMTEQNQQNQGNIKRKTAKKEKDNKSIYRHYKMLLHLCLKDAFTAFWLPKYEFIITPELREMPKLEDFLPEYKCNRYDLLGSKMRETPELQKWYMLARLINTRQGNRLAGSIRSYIQYVWDIDRRAKEIGNKLSRVVNKEITSLLTQALDIIDIVIQVSGTTSNILTDYFADEDEYAAFVSRFLDFEMKGFSDNISPSGKLKAFCDREVGNEKVGIFYDGGKPILNRNIILANLYGNSELLSDVLKDGKVTFNDICELKANETKISDYKSSGLCKDRQSRKELSKYQKLKNHVEFRDLVDYSELIDDMQAQLINWTYIRERDLMYFQLGFHYTCLNAENCQLDGYKKLNVEGGKIINNAILYQVLAMYTNGLRVFDLSGEKDKSAESTGQKVSAFILYSKAINKEDAKGHDIYNAGLELFETIKEHDDIVDLRNYIDHFKYYANRDRSILSIYSEVFDRFFSYDMRYRKNVVNLLYNILLKYLVIAKFNFGTSNKNVGPDTKEMARIQITGNKGLVSETFTYKLSNSDKVEEFARDEKFLINVARILCYPNDVPSCVIEGIKEAADKGKRKLEQTNNQAANRKPKEKPQSDDRAVYQSAPEPKGETAFERALREAQERKAAKEKQH